MVVFIMLSYLAVSALPVLFFYNAKTDFDSDYLKRTII